MDIQKLELIPSLELPPNAEAQGIVSLDVQSDEEDVTSKSTDSRNENKVI